MLGQPISMLIPEVVGFRLTGKLREGVTATDLVLTVTEMLRKKGVVGKFVEFYGPGLDQLALEDRATIANMAPEYGATCGFFPIDAETLRYLEHTGRDPERVALVEAYAKAQGMFRDDRTPDPVVHRHAGARSRHGRARRSPGRSGRRTACSSPRRSSSFLAALDTEFKKADELAAAASASRASHFDLGHGDVVIAAITSCTNTSNPYVMIGAGLLARNAVERRASRPSPGSRPRSPPAARWSPSISPAPACRATSTRSASTSSATAAPPASAIPARCRSRSPRRSTTATSSPPRCSPATAISRAASIRTSAPTTSPRRRWSSPMRSPARCRSISSPSRSALDRDGKPVYPQGHLAVDAGDRRVRPRQHHQRPLPHQVCRRVQRRRALAEDQGRRRPDLCLDRRLDLRAEPALFRGHAARAGAGDRHRRRPRPRAVPRFDHHRPHLARRLDQGDEPGRRLSDRASGASRPTSTSTARGAATTK